MIFSFLADVQVAFPRHQSQDEYALQNVKRMQLRECFNFEFTIREKESSEQTFGNRVSLSNVPEMTVCLSVYEMSSPRL